MATKKKAAVKKKVAKPKKVVEDHTKSFLHAFHNELTKYIPGGDTVQIRQEQADKLAAFIETL